MEKEHCQRCHREITAAEIALDWPIAMPVDGGDPTQDFEYVCPDCFGDGAYCACGALTSATDETNKCEECNDHPRTTDQDDCLAAWASDERETILLDVPRADGETDPSHVTCHGDGTVTYYSVYTQTWHHHVHHVSDRELAAMARAERDRVIKHLAK